MYELIIETTKGSYAAYYYRDNQYRINFYEKAPSENYRHVTTFSAKPDEAEGVARKIIREDIQSAAS